MSHLYRGFRQSRGGHTIVNILNTKNLTVATLTFSLPLQTHSANLRASTSPCHFPLALPTTANDYVVPKGLISNEHLNLSCTRSSHAPYSQQSFDRLHARYNHYTTYTFNSSIISFDPIPTYFLHTIHQNPSLTHAIPTMYSLPVHDKPQTSTTRLWTTNTYIALSNYGLKPKNLHTSCNQYLDDHLRTTTTTINFPKQDSAA